MSTSWRTQLPNESKWRYRLLVDQHAPPLYQLLHREKLFGRDQIGSAIAQEPGA